MGCTLPLWEAIAPVLCFGSHDFQMQHEKQHRVENLTEFWDASLKTEEVLWNPVH